MDRDELIKWKARYDKEEDLYDPGLETRLRDKFQKKRLITKDELIKIVEWKFQTLPGRRKRTYNLLASVEDNFIQNASKLAFQTEDDNTRLSLLCSIRGVGNALSSVILAFFDPDRYGVLDIHDWRELFGKEPRDIFQNPERAITFFNRLRELASQTGLSCRDVEKALFKKNLEESEKSRKSPGYE